jgi:hypothetical protein
MTCVKIQLDMLDATQSNGLCPFSLYLYSLPRGSNVVAIRGRLRWLRLIRRSIRLTDSRRLLTRIMCYGSSPHESASRC